MYDVSRNLLKVWETSDNILLMVHNKDMVAIEYEAYRMALLPMTLKVTFAVSNFSDFHTS